MVTPGVATGVTPVVTPRVTLVVIPDDHRAPPPTGASPPVVNPRGVPSGDPLGDPQ